MAKARVDLTQEAEHMEYDDSPVLPNLNALMNGRSSGRRDIPGEPSAPPPSGPGADDRGQLYTEATPTPTLERSQHAGGADDKDGVGDEDAQPPQPPQHPTPGTSTTGPADRTRRFLDDLQSMLETCAHLPQELSTVPPALASMYLDVNGGDEDGLATVKETVRRLRWGARECRAFNEKMRGKAAEARTS